MKPRGGTTTWRLTNGWSAVLALVAASWSGMAQADPPTPCVLQQIGELPVEMTGARAILPARINGAPARMIVDTGSGVTSLFFSGAARLGLSPARVDSVKVFGVGGEGGVGAVNVRFEMGGMSAPKYEMLVTGQHPGDADGLMGASFLLQSDVEFDLPEGKIRFFRPKGCKGDQVVYWRQPYAVAPMLESAGNTQILTPVQVNGVTLRALLDTGTPRSVLTTAGAARAGVTRSSPGVSAAGTSGGIGRAEVTTSVGTFQTFGFGEETIRNARLMIADLFHADVETHTGSRFATEAIHAPDMLLGIDFFRSHRIYVATSQRRIYVTYVGGPVFDTGAAAGLAGEGKGGAKDSHGP
jgi:predicted aspartyl protease